MHTAEELLPKTNEDQPSLEVSACSTGANSGAREAETGGNASAQMSHDPQPNKPLPLSDSFRLPWKWQ